MKTLPSIAHTWPYRHVVVCPKTGKIVRLRLTRGEAMVLFPLVGIAAVAWFLIRVIPKPSRINYPCQQVSAGIGGSFLAWVVGVCASMTAFRRIRPFLDKKHTLTLVAGAAAITCVGVWAGLIAHAFTLPTQACSAVLSAGEARNAPVGVARGLYPGRVVWARDTAATSWNGTSGHWWSDTCTNQAVVDRMFSRMLQTYANTTSDSAAWKALFQGFNSTHGRGNNGYISTEKIVIKLNANADGGGAWNNTGYPSPHVVYKLVSELIEVAHVPGANITIADPSRCIGDPIYNKIRANASPEYQAVWFAEGRTSSSPHRMYATPDSSSALWVKMGNGQDKKYWLPKCYTQATYLINLALLRPHRVFGVTLTSKNHFGSVFDITAGSYAPNALHDFAIWAYSYDNKSGDRHCHPYLTGHKDLGGKELVLIVDGLYTAKLQSNETVARWGAMGNDWCSSLFISQDPVAIQSVGYDLIASEPNMTSGNTCWDATHAANADNFLHECALAGNPPSATAYDPEKDGAVLSSLGVHEHWNDATHRQYSRNLGTGQGIELLQLAGDQVTATAMPKPGTAVGRAVSGFSHAVKMDGREPVLSLRFPPSASERFCEIGDARGRKCAGFAVPAGAGSYNHILPNLAPGQYLLTMSNGNRIDYAEEVVVGRK
jgi:hypothetical protein